MTRLRGLCIGAGYFARFHFEAWRRMEDVEIVGICDVDQEKARQAAEQSGVPHVFTDVEVALDEVDVEFVDVITRPDTHLSIVQAASRRGRAIICQKPLAGDIKTSQTIVETARRANVRLMVHENFRFQPWHREIKRLIAAGVIGERLHSLYFRSRPGDGWGAEAYLARQPYFRIMPRFLVHEFGVHFIDTFRFLAGEVDEVSAVLRRLNAAISGEDAGLLTFRFANGAVGVWDANRFNESTASEPRYTFGTFLVEGDGGSVRLDDDGRIFLKPLGQAEREHDYLHERHGFAGDCVFATQRHFIDCLRSGESFETSGDEYLKTLAVQEAAYESAATNRPVKIAPTCQTGEDMRRTNRRIVDLSLTINNELRGVTVTPFTTIAKKGWNSTTLSLYSHCGTHMDAPKHFLGDTAATIDQQPLDVCCGPARVLDLTPVAPRELLSVERIAPWADMIRPGERLLLRTDWHKRFGTDAYREELPRISVELARWLVEHRVSLIGVEPPSVADVNNLEEVTAVHRTLLGAKIVIVEGLTNLDQLRRNVVEFIAFPMKISNGDGSPVRAIAIED